MENEKDITSAHEEKEGSGAYRLVAEGSMEGVDMPKLQRRFVSHLKDTSASEVIMDLTRVEYMDSRGISVCIAVFKECRESGREFSLEANSNVYRLFTIMNLDKVMTIREVNP